MTGFWCMLFFFCVRLRTVFLKACIGSKAAGREVRLQNLCVSVLGVDFIKV